MTQLAADFAAKGLLNLMTSSPVVTGGHLILSNFHSESDVQSYMPVSMPDKQYNCQFRFFLTLQHRYTWVILKRNTLSSTQRWWS